MKTDLSFHTQPVGDAASFNDIRYGNGAWVAVSSTSIWRSTDSGATWQIVYDSPNDYMRSIEFADNMFFVIRGDRGLFSSDGASWTEFNAYYTPVVNTDGPDVGSVNAYAVNPVPSYGSYEDFWQVIVIPATTNTGPATLDVSDLGPLPIFEQDGITPISAGTIIAGKPYVFSIWYGLDGPAGFTYSLIDIPEPANAISDLYGKVAAYGEDNFVFCGQVSPYDSSFSIITTPDLQTWTVSITGMDNETSDEIVNVRYLQGTFYAVGYSGNAYSSPDGFTWTKLTGGALEFASSDDFFDIAYVSSTFVILGDSGQIYTSPDGLIWTDRGVIPGASWRMTRLKVAGSSLFAVGESSGLFRSDDAGVTWIPVDCGGELAFGMAGFDHDGTATMMAVGYNGNIRRSTNNGATWTHSRGTEEIYGVFCANGNTIVGIVDLTSPYPPNYTGVRISYDNGQTWTSGYGFETLNNSYYSGIAYGAGLYVAVGDDGMIRTSPDGITWTSRTSGTANDIDSITFVNGRFIAGGQNFLITSLDGITWSSGSLPGGLTSKSLRGVVWTGTAYFALFFQSFSTTIIVTSANGSTWTTSATLAAECQSIAYNGTVLATVGRQTKLVYTSPDGVTWTTQPASNKFSTPFHVRAFGSRFIITGFHTIAYSDDNGVSWTSSLYGYGESVTMWLAAPWLSASDLFCYDSWNDTLIQSTDLGETWSKYSVSMTPGKIKLLNGAYIMINNNTIMHSFDLNEPWTKTEMICTDKILNVTYGNGAYVAVGNNGLILRSTDGLGWSWIQRSGANRPQTLPALKSVTFGNNLFVAVGKSGVITTSPDGITWTDRTSGVSTDLLGVTYGNGSFVAITINNFKASILTSNNGISWSLSQIPGQETSEFLSTSIDYFDGRFFFTAVPDYIGYSTDLVNWTRVPMYNNPAAIVTVVKDTAQSLYVAADMFGGISTSEDLSSFEYVQRIPVNIGLVYQDSESGWMSLVDDVLYLTGSIGQSWGWYRLNR